MRRPLIAGNWKMNGLRREGVALAATLARRYAEEKDPRFDMLVCPPATLVWPVAEAVAESGVAVGGQDCHPEEKGAHTGDISVAMLAEAGCRYCIVGHSERRADHGETDAVVRAKAAAVHETGLVAVICIGETEVERDAGRTLDVVASQLAGSLPEAAGPPNTVIAYEPVWAIGTGRTPTTDDVAQVHSHIRGELGRRVRDGGKVRILYGGSVNPKNAGELLGIDDVDGALVGGASLKADDFWAIALSCP